MKEIDSYANMGFAVDITKGVDLTQLPQTQVGTTNSPLETEELAEDMQREFGKFKPVLGVSYAHRARNSSK